MILIIKMFFMVLLQNASFTLVSRARNSSSILYHAGAAVLSNGIWIIVVRQVIKNPDNWILITTYVIAAVIGSIGMHYITMRWIEKPKVVGPKFTERHIEMLEDLERRTTINSNVISRILDKPSARPTK